MKKASLLMLALFLATSAFSQTGGDKDQLNPQPLPPHKHPGIETKTDKKATKTKSGKKGAKKGAAATPTPAPSPAAK